MKKWNVAIIFYTYPHAEMAQGQKLHSTVFWIWDAPDRIIKEDSPDKNK